MCQHFREIILYTTTTKHTVCASSLSQHAVFATRATAVEVFVVIITVDVHFIGLYLLLQYYAFYMQLLIHATNITLRKKYKLFELY